MITAALLSELPGVTHGFFTRGGGVSEGLYASLNCGLGSGDDRAKVAENRARAARSFGLDAARLLSVYQIHSPSVIEVHQPWAAENAPRADAMVTDRKGLMLGVLAADCAPVLLADVKAGVIGAAHAGWRGALVGVVEATVAAMEKLGAARASMRAAIGPCIMQASYEVGGEFPAPFLAQDPNNRAHFIAGARPGKFHFDLPGYLMARLEQAGIAAIHCARDTQAEESDFFSFRRATLRGEQHYGRCLSAIALRE